MSGGAGEAEAPRLRAFREGDLEAVIAVWHETKQDAYPYLPLEQGRSLEQDAEFFRAHILPRCAIFVAEIGARLAGFVALAGSYVDRLYIHPDQQRRGVGSLLLAKVIQLSPQGVELHTHQKNVSACAFYEKHGFRAVHYGTSPPPESEPDVEYHWRPASHITGS
jgi:ribosomal protein S18 acetylase RimI-like enzyme